MRLDTNVVSTESNITAPGTEVGFDPEAFGHIMSILSNMYSDIALAVIREYSANAHDSHVAAGITDPILVTLPTTLNPTYVVQDKGLGLSKDQILNVYGRYGKSTKRDTNDQIGGFGIGAKAAFALGHQFVVTGVKDGQKVVVLFALNSRNVGEMKVVHEGPTTEPNGVTVSMAVEDVDDFCQKAHTFFGKWAPGTVLVDGSQPQSVYDDAQEINESVHVVPDHEGDVWLTLGQIAYPVSRNILNKARTLLRERGDSAAEQTLSTMMGWYNSSALFLHAEIGSAEIAPTRESLMDTGLTVSTVADLVATIPATLLESVQESVDACQTGVEAARTLWRVKAEVAPLTFDTKAVTWRGMALPQSVNVEGSWIVGGTKSSRASRIVAQGAASYTVDASKVDKVLVIPNVGVDEAASIRRFATRFINSSQYSAILLGGKDVTGLSVKWFNYEVVDNMTVEEYKAFLKALPKAPRTATEPHYTVNESRYEKDKTYRTPLSEIVDEGKDVVVRMESASFSDLAWEAIKAQYNVLVLGPTQTEEALERHLAKMEADISIVSVEEWKQVVDDHARSLYNATDDEKAALGARAWLEEHGNNICTWREWYAALSEHGEVTYKTFAEVQENYDLATLIADDITPVRVKELAQAAQVLSSDDEQVIPFDAEVPAFGQVFPLISSIGYWDRRNNPALMQQALAFVNSL